MDQNLNKIKELKHYIKAVEIEKKILAQNYNLDNELRIFDVEVILNGLPTFIHTYVIGENNQETLVMLHGFGGSSLTFYKMYKQLATRFRVFALDFIGMGLSDRQNFNVVENATQVINFFVNSIEQWRKVLGIQQFRIAGHSFGGYMAANYTVKYPSQVIETYLLSPMAGTKVTPENDLQSEERFQEFVNKQPFLRKWAMKYMRCQAENQKMTPGKLLKKWFIPGNYLLKRAVQSRLKISDKTEAELWKNFLKNIFKLPQSTEHHIHDLVSMPGAQARLSIEQVVMESPNKIDVEFTIMFGDDDWMNKTGCQRLFKENYLQGRVVEIKDAGHQLPFDQPDDITNKILEQTKINIQVK
ncbi:alpha/beta fold hydrolase (macronuclear) [Tetrahymena thermophila SB210]|uniref:Alpha/beta fold hydrolase n=1 Tax=Tetrahymena thermophila (strain SB210) TaxID=312017 RepID=Q230X1_TETTS|nr:alpha/beta fold hydrolase [Tetrahymena thermophila SB210]EAR91168.1 alpha/beta fold hydrolase [Tetrahymena thermophila SB210]|eukprot:XP_001011413.1 alpha/beta fold hydrolase [Tetrahymena thermophila SB210]